MHRAILLSLTLSLGNVGLPAMAQSAPSQDTKENAMATERITIDSPNGDFSMTLEKPQHWIMADLPAEAQDTDFADPMKFAPVCLVVDPTNQESRPPMFLVAARPAYADGSVAQWLEAICEDQKLKHGPIERAQFGDSPAVYCMAQMTTEDEARMVVVLLEDGGRLINLAFLTPADKWDANTEMLNTFLNSFRLTNAKGPTAALTTEENKARPSSDLALADDTSTLDPENKINANLRNNGIGLVPNVVKKDDQTKTATLACGALQSFIDLPYGWHAIDDGRRVLIFDPQNLTQINCAMVDREGASDEEILEKTLEQLERDAPGFDHKIDEIDGTQVLMVRDVVIDGEKTQQAYMLAAAADPRYRVKIRISSTGDMNHMVRSINVGEQIKKTLRR
jgi:hypothetical protein